MSTSGKRLVIGEAGRREEWDFDAPMEIAARGSAGSWHGSAMWPTARRDELVVKSFNVTRESPAKVASALAASPHKSCRPSSVRLAFGVEGAPAGELQVTTFKVAQ